MATQPIDEKSARRFTEQVIAGAREIKIKVKPDAVKWTVAKIDPTLPKDEAVLSSSGLGKDDPGHTLEEALEIIQKKKISCRGAEFMTLGAKGGVLLAKKLWLVILDCDAPGAFEKLCAFDKRFALTFAQRGSRLGHLFILTDASPPKLSAYGKGEMIGIEGLGGHVFAFSPHRNGKDFYKIERDAPLSFIPLKEIFEAIRTTATTLGGKWNSDPEKKATANSKPRENVDGGVWLTVLETHRKHDGKLDTLMLGVMSGYKNDKGEPDRSGFDMALAVKCAYYNLSQNEIESALEMFGSDKQNKRPNYVQDTAKKALGMTTNRWKPSNDSSSNRPGASDGNDEGAKYDDGVRSSDGVHNDSEYSTGRASSASGEYNRKAKLEDGPKRGFPEPVRLADFHPPKMEFLVEDLLTKDSIDVLAAESGAGKSTLAHELMACVASGRPFLGLEVKQTGRATLFDEDNEPYLLREKFDRINKAHPEFADKVNENVSLLNYGGRDAFFAHLAKIEKAPETAPVLIVLDVYRAFLVGSENDSEITSDFLLGLKTFCATTHTTILLIHHYSKPPGGKGAKPEVLDRLRGSGALRGACSAIYTLERWKNESKVEFAQDKCRWGQPFPPMVLSFVYGPDSLRVDVAQRDIDRGYSQLQAHVERFLKEAKAKGWTEFTRKDVEVVLGLKKSSASALVGYGRDGGYWKKARGEMKYLLPKSEQQHFQNGDDPHE